ncbi:MAG: type I restriction endonuclease subunit R, partial [Spirochaetales bacterium]|nr:type I restriction endonuclease subunit R [Spirochaetales bacterium]
EYDNFEPNCANSNSSSRILREQLKNDTVNIIITTIQKLSNLMKPNFWDKDEKLREILTKENIVLIFDECHRSQFGDMHTIITKRIKKYMMFGFTGTPIFAINASSGRTAGSQEQPHGHSSRSARESWALSRTMTAFR